MKLKTAKTVLRAAVALVLSLLLTGSAHAQAPVSYLEAVAAHAASPAPAVRGAEFPWNAATSPYAELVQSSGAIVVRAPANQGFVMLVTGVDQVTTKMALTINGTRTEIAGQPNAQGEFALPPQTLPVGTFASSVEACHEFACSAPLAFTLTTVPPPTVPSSIRLGQVISASLKAIAEALDQVIADRSR